ncbi:MAG: aminoacyl-tRNA hydrolase [Deltaproteobacteria bacterium]|nr:aminoacyl-tRNA hydrolase [Deltaproteobacteria bacterium]
MSLIRITDSIYIDEGEIKEEFIRASGPGGQHVNKVSTAVQLRFDIRGSALPEDVKRRLFNLAGGKVTGEGVVIISARQSRSREQNREDALYRLVDLIRKATEKPKARIKTRATFSSKKRRLESKTMHARTKKMRKSIKGDD